MEDEVHFTFTVCRPQIYGHEKKRVVDFAVDDERDTREYTGQ